LGRPSTLTTESSHTSPIVGPAEAPGQLVGGKMLCGVDLAPLQASDAGAGSSFEVINLECAEPMNLAFLGLRGEEKREEAESQPRAIPAPSPPHPPSETSVPVRKLSVSSAFVEVVPGLQLPPASW
jgi:hypothetical protein